MFQTIRSRVLPVIAVGCFAAFGAYSNFTASAHDGHSVAELVNEVANGDHRSEKNRARNEFRHPGETLAFFGLQKGQTVVEISPGGGWYTEILAPFLKSNGTFYSAGYDPDSEMEYYNRNGKKFLAMLAADPKSYSEVKPTIFMKGDYNIAPAGSADLVVTFRNLHNWMNSGYHEDSFKAFFKALKPGGILGFVEHRADPDKMQDPKADTGYVREDMVIKMIEAAGFEFDGKSEVNANAKDTRDHPEGVWTLPPGFRLKDKDRAKYASIGESDRMTLRFKKPDNSHMH